MSEHAHPWSRPAISNSICTIVFLWYNVPLFPQTTTSMTNAVASHAVLIPKHLYFPIHLLLQKQRRPMLISSGSGPSAGWQCDLPFRTSTNQTVCPDLVPGQVQTGFLIHHYAVNSSESWEQPLFLQNTSINTSDTSGEPPSSSTPRRAWIASAHTGLHIHIS